MPISPVWSRGCICWQVHFQRDLLAVRHALASSYEWWTEFSLGWTHCNCWRINEIFRHHWFDRSFRCWKQQRGRCGRLCFQCRGWNLIKGCKETLLSEDPNAGKKKVQGGDKSHGKRGHRARWMHGTSFCWWFATASFVYLPLAPCHNQFNPYGSALVLFPLTIRSYRSYLADPSFWFFVTLHSVSGSIWTAPELLTRPYQYQYTLWRQVVCWISSLLHCDGTGNAIVGLFISWCTTPAEHQPHPQNLRVAPQRTKKDQRLVSIVAIKSRLHDEYYYLHQHRP